MQIKMQEWEIRFLITSEKTKKTMAGGAMVSSCKLNAV